MRNVFKKINKRFLLNLLIIILFFIIPWIIFRNKLWIGGDDTRLFYFFPELWLRNICSYSWVHLSITGYLTFPFYVSPFLVLLSLLKKFGMPALLIQNICFSLILILGFIFQKKFLEEITSKKHQYLSILGGLVYTLSPILLITPIKSYLYAVWLIPTVPILAYYFIKYLKQGLFRYVIYASIFSLILSMALASIPWALGALLPISLVLFIFLFLTKRKEILIFIKRSLAFLGILFLVQSFWFIPFISQIFLSGSFARSALELGTTKTFASTVNIISKGNTILYPLLNLFHHVIQFDFNWPTRFVYSNFYDKFIFLDFIYIIIIFLGLFLLRKNDVKFRKLYFCFFIAFMISLFFFTVRIGFLYNVFLSLGNIPGFVMFRNFQDKFALGYVWLFSIVIFLSLINIKSALNPKIAYLIYGLLIITIIINAIPFARGDIINTPLWTTKNIHMEIKEIPKEYTDFMAELKHKVSPASNILSVPFNLASYAIIKEDGANNVYAGRSPVELFTGINDFSGSLSFPQEESFKLEKFIINRDYGNLRNFLRKYNINYVLLTKNIPDEVKDSYLFNKAILEYQDDNFIKAITNKKILTSKNGNYELYSVKDKNLLLNSNNLTFQKINPVEYKLYIKNLKDSQYLTFLDSFNKGWKLYLKKNPSDSWCKPKEQYLVRNIAPDERKKIIPDLDNEDSLPSFLNNKIEDIPAIKVFNGDFEMGQGGTNTSGPVGQIESGWEALFYGAQGNVSYDNSVFFSGKQSLKMNATKASKPKGQSIGEYIEAKNTAYKEGNSIINIKYGIPVKKNTKYRISVRYKTKDISNISGRGAYGAIKRMKDDGSYYGEYNTNFLVPGMVSGSYIRGTNDWTTVTNEFTTNENDAYWQFCIYLHSETGTIWIDDLNLEGLDYSDAFSDKFIAQAKILEEKADKINPSEVTECNPKFRFYQGGEFSYLWQKPVFDEKHQLANEWANAWEIDPDYIKDHYSSNYYKQNTDGSIDIELILFFKPQLYFYLGLIVSGTTLIFCLGYLIFDWLKNRKKRKIIVNNNYSL